jgi:hypothetical protein
VEEQVVAFVKAVLDPLYREQLVPRELYKLVAARATAKVMQRHGQEPDASFLIRHGEDVSKLVHDLLEHYRKEDI